MCNKYVSHMGTNTTTIRELRTDFRSVKRKIEEHGHVIVTDRGEPAYVIRALPTPPVEKGRLPDYYGRLTRRQPNPLSAEETRRFWEEERG
jgi:antitoxin (DNA-binding transcriptional repressor) of toxin-antitoxin stability system